VIVLDNKLIQVADCYIDENHETFSELGESFFNIFSYDTRNNRISTQVRNLQQITCSATRFSDIEDFVKNQMGKEKTDNQNPPRWKKLGGEILQQLEQLRDKSQKLNTDPHNQMALRLRLARGWVRAVVSAYLYQVARDQMGGTP
jgi:hypothetical protein